MRTTGLRVLGVAAVCGVCATGVVIGATGDAKAPKRRAHHHLRAAHLSAFNGCPALESYVRHRAVVMTGAYGMPYAYSPAYAVRDAAGVTTPTAAVPAASPAPQSSASTGSGSSGTTFSGTNVQEVGVDEPDTVKTDGTTVFIATATGVKAVRAGASPATLDTLTLKDVTGSQLLLLGNRLVVISYAGGVIPMDVVAPSATGSGGGSSSPGSTGSAPVTPAPATSKEVAADTVGLVPFQQSTVVTEVDVSDPAHMKVLETLKLEGRFVAARQSDGTFRLVVSTTPNVTGFVYPGAPATPTTTQAIRRNRSIVRHASISSWLPVYRLHRAGGGTVVKAAVRCRDVAHSSDFSGLSVLSVLTIDPAKGLTPVDRDAVMTDGDIVYGSTGSLYVTTPNWVGPQVFMQGKAPDNGSTQIHRFQLDSPTSTSYQASGRVSGYVQNQWSLSEQDGVLRVASTDQATWDATTGQQATASTSQITTLRQQGDKLVKVGQLSGLGPGERIYGVRFIGNTGYVVTFRQMDPLYVVDLTDPAKPVLKGQLKIPGYSAYLHPVGDGLLLGVGQDATATGHSTGTQMSLFNVSDPSNPRRVATLRVPDGWSEAENDHHAFLYWPATHLAVIPVTTYEMATGAGKPMALAVRVNPTDITSVGRITHPATKDNPWLGQIHRSLVVNGSLMTVSDAGVQANDLGTLATTGWTSLQ